MVAMRNAMRFRSQSVLNWSHQREEVVHHMKSEQQGTLEVVGR